MPIPTGYETEDGLHIVSSSEVRMPQELENAFLTLLSNLDMYKPFLPQAVLPHDDNDEHQWPVSPLTPSSGDHPPALHTPGCAVHVIPEPHHGATASEAGGSSVTDSVSRVSRVSSPQSIGVPNCMQVGVARRHPAGTLMVARLEVPCDFASSVASGAAFAAAAINAAQASGGIPAGITTGDCHCLVTVSWNVHRRCATHARTACETALAAAADIRYAQETPRGAKWSLAVTGGAMISTNIGGEAFRVPVLYGAPVLHGAAAAAVCIQLRVCTACDEQIFAKVRADIPARVVDTVELRSGRELIVYELLHSWSAVSHDQYLRAFSAMRRGRFEEARDLLVAELCGAQKGDPQVNRLLAVSAMLAACGGNAEYVRRMQMPFQDFEGDAAVAAAEGHFSDRVRALLDFSGSSPTSSSSTSRTSVRQLTPRRDSASELSIRVHPAGQKPADDGQLLAERLDALMKGGAGVMIAEPIPTRFSDARGRLYHRSSTKLGKGAFGDVWLGMANDGSMVAVKSLVLPGHDLMSRDSGTDHMRQSRDGDSDDEEAGSEGSWATVQWSNTLMRSAAAMNPRASACDVSLQQRTLLSTAQTRRRVADMVQEITLMTALQHENVVQYLGCAVEGVYILIVMEYIPGGSLQGLAQQFGGTLPAGSVPRFITDITRGLDFIHGRGIVHRDLKPANVLVTVEGQARLADFGASAELAAHSGGGAAGQGASGGPQEGGNVVSLVGTPLYMAPEQARGRAVAASDIWALGIVLCELLTGAAPWPAAELRDPMAFVRKLALDPDYLPRVGDGGMGTQAQALAELCLVRDPQERPTARHVLAHPYLLSQ
eukprot:TRINITY_DN13403_c0_g2_i1.p1 TRINITY_DN13403_c0_g2~~TRINITY_DN13403_c0_g2_i1.p1  ORF type:complete len:830 (+),score=161.27 TRINITY_DN13403_c0_g2_i1:776-3265(+)